MTKILDGRAVAKQLNEETRATISELEHINITPTLAIMRADENPSSIQYEKSATRFMDKLGIQTKHVTFPEGISQEELLQELEKLNKDNEINGILIMQPLPKNIDLKVVADKINPEKDIDGMSGTNLGRIMLGEKNTLLPSTVKAVLEIIRFYGLPVEYQEITVVGRSNTVGKPLSVILMTRGATVTTCHTRTQKLIKHTKNADILIAAAGKIGLITEEHVKPGTIVIDVGFNFEEGKAYGDVVYDEVEPLASKITPVPGGVGSVTTAALARQVADAAKWQQMK